MSFPQRTKFCTWSIDIFAWSNFLEEKKRTIIQHEQGFTKKFSDFHKVSFYKISGLCYLLWIIYFFQLLEIFQSDLQCYFKKRESINVK